MGCQAPYSTSANWGGRFPKRAVRILYQVQNFPRAPPPRMACQAHNCALWEGVIDGVPISLSGVGELGGQAPKAGGKNTVPGSVFAPRTHPANGVPGSMLPPDQWAPAKRPWTYSSARHPQLLIDGSTTGLNFLRIGGATSRFRRPGPAGETNPRVESIVRPIQVRPAPRLTLCDQKSPPMDSSPPG